MKKLICFLLPLFLLCMPVRAGAEEAAVPIYTVEDLLAVGENPSGSYILMADLDLQGVEWPCPDFSGSFDGNGHAISTCFWIAPAQPWSRPTTATGRAMMWNVWACSA